MNRLCKKLNNQKIRLNLLTTTNEKKGDSNKQRKCNPNTYTTDDITKKGMEKKLVN